MNKILFLYLTALGFPCITLFAQGGDSLVNKNKQKIEALMKDLDNLKKRENLSQKEKDDCEKQTTMLSNQIMELQEQLKNNQTEVQRLTTLITESVPVKNKLNNSNSLKKGEGCYVVIKSFRSEDKAGEWVKKNNTESVRIIRNIGKTWYHIVLDNPVSVSDAGKIVYNKRQNGFPDAWWKTAEYFE